jgi:hypothetical protein
MYLMLSETSSNSSCLFGTQIQRQVFLLLISFPQSCLLFLWNHSQNLCYWKPDDFSASKQLKKKKSNLYTKDQGLNMLSPKNISTNFILVSLKNSFKLWSSKLSNFNVRPCFFIKVQVKSSSPNEFFHHISLRH